MQPVHALNREVFSQELFYVVLNYKAPSYITVYLWGVFGT